MIRSIKFNMSPRPYNHKPDGPEYGGGGGKAKKVQTATIRGEQVNFSYVRMRANGIPWEGELSDNQQIQGLHWSTKDWVSFHDNGQIERGSLLTGAEIQGIPCESNIVMFHPDGRLQGAHLSEDAVIQEYSFRAGTSIFFDKESRLVETHVGRSGGTALDIPLIEGDVVEFLYRENRDRFIIIILSGEREIQGIPCFGNGVRNGQSYVGVEFYPNNRIQHATLSRDFDLCGINLEAGTRIELVEEGKLIGANINHPMTIRGVEYPYCASCWKPETGWIHTATLYKNVTYKDPLGKIIPSRIETGKIVFDGDGNIISNDNC